MPHLSIVNSQAQQCNLSVCCWPLLDEKGSCCLQMVLACKVAVLPQYGNLRCLQDPEAIPAARVLITDASCPTLEDHIEGMEFESHYGDMRTEIQEVGLTLSTPFCMQ